MVLATFPVEPGALDRFVPPGVSLDLWEGQALASVVGLRFHDTRLLGCPVPLHRHFPELNLRFYVRRATPDGTRHGVVFLREIVPRRAVAVLARALYNENYIRRPLRSVVEPGRKVAYEWRCGRVNRLAVELRGEPALVEPESLESFLLDHLWGYTKTRSEGCMEYRVTREPWRVVPVESYEFDVDAACSFGPELKGLLRGRPTSVIYAEGSPVSVSFGRRT